MNKTNCDLAVDVPLYFSIHWKKVEKHVHRLQKRLAKAVEEKNKRAIRYFKHLIRNSNYAKCLAIRKVTQQNPGKNTPGIDQKIYHTPEKREKLLQEINLNKKPLPIKRIYIPKTNGKPRPLGIPTIHDRVCQEIHKMAMEPEWDVQFERHSYGFRPAYSTKDAIQQTRILLCKEKSPVWIIEGDIRSFFDQIDHEKLLNKCSCEDRTYIRRTLKAPIIEPRKEKKKVTKGVPQGGNISPLLANIAIHGLENFLKRFRWVNIVRFADDFIITCRTQEQAKALILETDNWLKENVGVELNREKTKITHINDGFNFLGFHFRKYAKGTLHIKPDKERVKNFLREIQGYLNSHQQEKQETVIQALNLKIKGFTEYYKNVKSKETFRKVDHQIWQKLWKWAKRRHKNKSVKWVKKRYFQRIRHRDWIFATEEKEHILNIAQHTWITCHIKIQSGRSIYRIEDTSYFLNRWKQQTLKYFSGKAREVLEKTDAKCWFCGSPITEQHWKTNGKHSIRRIEFHHAIPKKHGGNDTVKNLFAVHAWCHTRHHRKFKDCLPENPYLYLTPQEEFMDGKVVVIRKLNEVNSQVVHG